MIVLLFIAAVVVVFTCVFADRRELAVVWDVLIGRVRRCQQLVFGIL